MNQGEHDTTYLQYLPPVFSEKYHTPSGFLSGTLKVFEQFFTGRPETGVPLETLPVGLVFPEELKGRIQYDSETKRLIFQGALSEEELKALRKLAPTESEYQESLTELFHLSHSFRYLLDRMDSYLDPQEAPEEFIGWLAERLGLALGEEWELGKKRAILSAAMQLYRIRGTRRGLEEYLKIYTGREDLRVVDETGVFQVEVASQLEAGATIEGLPSYFFLVELGFPPEPALLKAKLAELKELIDLEKPAHTRYQILAVVPALQVERQSTVEVDTLFWEWTEHRYMKEEKNGDSATIELL